MRPLRWQPHVSSDCYFRLYPTDCITSGLPRFIAAPDAPGNACCSLRGIAAPSVHGRRSPSVGPPRVWGARCVCGLEEAHLEDEDAEDIGEHHQRSRNVGTVEQGGLVAEEHRWTKACKCQYKLLGLQEGAAMHSCSMHADLFEGQRKSNISEAEASVTIPGCKCELRASCMHPHDASVWHPCHARACKCKPQRLAVCSFQPNYACIHVPPPCCVQVVWRGHIRYAHTLGLNFSRYTENSA